MHTAITAPLGRLEIETIRACNARCVMCPISNSEKPAVYMKDDLFSLIVEQVAELPTKPHVALYGLGEPLMDKRLEARAQALRAVGVPWISITTNASLLTEERVLSIVAAGVNRIEVSLDCIQKEVYEAIRVNLDFEVVSRNIVNLLSLARTRNFPVTIGILGIISERTSPYINEYLEFFRTKLRPNVDFLNIVPAHNFGQAFSTLPAGTAKCGMPIQAVHILADGTFSLCCCDSEAVYDFGNLRTDRILDVYNSEKVREIHLRHLNGQRHTLEMCATCSIPECHRLQMIAFANEQGQLVVQTKDGRPPSLPGDVKIGPGAGLVQSKTAI